MVYACIRPQINLVRVCDSRVRLRISNTNIVDILDVAAPHT